MRVRLLLLVGDAISALACLFLLAARTDFTMKSITTSLYLILASLVTAATVVIQDGAPEIGFVAVGAGALHACLEAIKSTSRQTLYHWKTWLQWLCIATISLILLSRLCYL